MPQRCAVCGQIYFPEVGFYWGAMYISYGLTVLFSAINVGLLWLLFGFNMWLLIIGNAILLLAGMPLFYRYSRAIWLMFFVSFDQETFERTRKNSAS